MRMIKLLDLVEQWRFDMRSLVPGFLVFLLLVGIFTILGSVVYQVAHCKGTREATGNKDYKVFAQRECICLNSGINDSSLDIADSSTITPYDDKLFK